MMTSSIYVPHSGPIDAEILIIGEAPGSDETRLREPFIGESGQMLRSVLVNRKFDESKIRFANIVNYQPENNKFDSLTEGEIKEGLQEILSYLSLHRPKIVILCGNIPLQYILGKYKIDNWRGSVIQKEGIYFIPTKHPAFILRSPDNYAIFDQDIGKAYKIYTKGYTTPTFSLTINPTGIEYEECLDEIKQAGFVSVDIETVKYTNNILCCGFAINKERAICVPNYGNQVLDNSARRFYETILSDPDIKKLFHNGAFDIEILNNNGIITENFAHDTHIMHHVLAPELPRTLDYITSIYTDIPYYKDRGRLALPENEKGWGKLKDQDKLNVYEYNCLDVCATYWCYMEMAKEIGEDEDFLHIYKQEMEMHEVSFELTRNGMLVDQERNALISNKLRQQFIDEQKLLDAVIGRSINSGSPTQVKKLLYEEWKLPERKGKDGKISSGEDALVSLIGWTKDHINGLSKKESKIEWMKKLTGIICIIKIQGIRKLLSSYIDIPISIDGRIRSFYRIPGTETGRWSCDKYLDDTGLNGQTMPRGSV